MGEENGGNDHADDNDNKADADDVLFVRQIREVVAPNLVRVMGACLDNVPPFIVTELCPKGSLQVSAQTRRQTDAQTNMKTDAQLEQTCKY